jgi:hydroxymethylpyrimidine kinase/phosphomethylpyrimidine kinase
MNRTILTISAFDSSCATGIAADLKTFQTFRVYGVGVVTAITAQNTSSVQALQPIPMEIVGQQMEALVSDIQIHAVKVGVLATAANVQIVMTLIEAFNLKGTLVVDPILQAATGEPLLESAGIPLLRDNLIPMAHAITPNRHEAEVLSGVPVRDVASAKEAARILHQKGCKNVIVTGDAFDGPRAMDLWYDGLNFHIFDASKIPSKNTLGVGTTFSAVLCALLARGCLMGESIDRAKKYIAKAIQHPFQIGKGYGPLNHTVPI